MLCFTVLDSVLLFCGVLDLVVVFWSRYDWVRELFCGLLIKLSTCTLSSLHSQTNLFASLVPHGEFSLRYKLQIQVPTSSEA